MSLQVRKLRILTFYIHFVFLHLIACYVTTSKKIKIGSWRAISGLMKSVGNESLDKIDMFI